MIEIGNSRFRLGRVGDHSRLPSKELSPPSRQRQNGLLWLAADLLPSDPVWRMPMTFRAFATALLTAASAAFDDPLA
jgi:hypothetical protein